MHRRNFIIGTAVLGFMNFLPSFGRNSRNFVQTVTGSVDVDMMGYTLEHEHVLVDFIGAGQAGAHRYNREEVFETVLPYLKQLKKLGFKTFVECTPQYLGRDVILLKKLSLESGLNIITNTGLYGTQNGKYLPAYAFHESPEQLAERWISEWERGIENTGVKPGFIKISVDKAPIKDFQANLVKAAAITHLSTGLTIASHTGEAEAALEQLEILKEHKVHPSAFIWVHAQAEKSPDKHLQVLQKGTWASYDGAAWEKPERYYELINFAKESGFMDQVLISHDAGWYHVGEQGGGEYKGYDSISNFLIPLMKSHGYQNADIEKLLKINPVKALEIKVRKINS